MLISILIAPNTFNTNIAYIGVDASNIGEFKDYTINIGEEENASK